MVYAFHQLTFTAVLLASVSRVIGKPQPCPNNADILGYVDSESLRTDIEEFKRLGKYFPENHDFVLCPESETSETEFAQPKVNGILHEKVLSAMSANLQTFSEEAAAGIDREIEELRENDPGVALWDEMNDNGNETQDPSIRRNLRTHSDIDRYEARILGYEEWRHLFRDVDEALIVSEYVDFLETAPKVDLSDRRVLSATKIRNLRSQRRMQYHA